MRDFFGTLEPCQASFSTSARLRASWSAAMKWLPIQSKYDSRVILASTRS